MKVSDIKAVELSLHNEEIVYSTAWKKMNGVLVMVETDEGITGIGESFRALSLDAVVSLIEGGLKRFVIGENPLNIEKLVYKMFQLSTYVGRTGITRHAIAGIEIALWDIFGKVNNVPIYQLLGGIFREKVKAYASLPRIEKLNDVSKYLKECVKRGFKAIKLHQMDMESISIAREVVDYDVEIMVDANCAWSRKEALFFARACEKYDVRWLEEPIKPADDLKGLAELRATSDIPIASGENESSLRGFMDMMKAGAVDIIQPSVTKIGGLLIGKKACVLAEVLNVEVAPHSWTLPLGVAASLHLAISSPTCNYIEVPPRLKENLVKTPLRFKDGYAIPPEKPGLGIELDERVISENLH